MIKNYKNLLNFPSLDKFVGGLVEDFILTKEGGVTNLLTMDKVIALEYTYDSACIGGEELAIITKLGIPIMEHNNHPNFYYVKPTFIDKWFEDNKGEGRGEESYERESRNPNTINE